MIDKLFYIVYNNYYKHGEYKKDIPSLTVGGIFTILLFSIFLTLHFIIFYEVSEKEIIDQLGFSKGALIWHSLMIVAAVLAYFRFFWRGRNMKIYSMYKSDEYLNSRRAKRIGFLIVLFLTFLPIIYAIIRAHFGFSSLVSSLSS